MKIPEDVSKNIAEYQKKLANMRAAKMEINFNIELELADPHIPRLHKACRHLQDRASCLHSKQQQLIQQTHLDAAAQEGLSLQLSVCQ
ncbi:hypothetical protein EON64_21140, partial [archaeon]